MSFSFFLKSFAAPRLPSGSARWAPRVLCACRRGACVVDVDDGAVADDLRKRQKTSKLSCESIHKYIYILIICIFISSVSMILRYYDGIMHI